MRSLRRSTAMAIAAVAAAAILARPVAAQPLPPYAASLGEARIHGFVVGFDGRYALQVRDERGFIDRVQLRDGTIIVPIGDRLPLGLLVSIRGTVSGATFVANEIDALDPRESTNWQGYDPYGCSNAPAPPVHGGPYTSWRYDTRC